MGFPKQDLKIEDKHGWKKSLTFFMRQAYLKKQSTLVEEKEKSTLSMYKVTERRLLNFGILMNIKDTSSNIFEDRVHLYAFFVAPTKEYDLALIL